METSVNTAAAMRFIHPVPIITPTVSELLDASLATSTTEYNNFTGPLTMGDLTPFYVDGKPLVTQDLSTGLLGAAFLTPLHQLIIAYEPTVGITTTGYTQAFENAQLNADVTEALTGTSPNLPEAVTFAQLAEADAARQGISTANVFVTGDSLGGTEAEYVAQQTGLAGIAFEPPGIPASATAPGTGANFVDVVTYGDPVANLTSDIDAEQPIAPTYVAGGGALPHYGQELFVGNPSDESYIATSLAPYLPGFEQAQANGTTAGFFSSLIGTYLTIAEPFHNPATTAYNLGTSLPLAQEIEALGYAHESDGHVLHVANDTLGQLLTYIAATHGNTVAPGLV